MEKNSVYERELAMVINLACRKVMWMVCLRELLMEEVSLVFWTEHLSAVVLVEALAF